MTNRTSFLPSRPLGFPVYAFLFAAFVMLALPAATDAYTKEVRLEDIVKGASTIIAGRVSTVRETGTEGEFRVYLNVDETLKGESPGGMIAIRFSSGKGGAASFKVGERCAIFVNSLGAKLKVLEGFGGKVIIEDTGGIKDLEISDARDYLDFDRFLEKVRALAGP